MRQVSKRVRGQSIFRLGRFEKAKAEQGYKRRFAPAKIVVFCVLLLPLISSILIPANTKNNSKLLNEVVEWDNRATTVYIEEYIDIYTQEARQMITPKTLYDLAYAKVQDLEQTGYWSHTNSDGCDFNCRTQEYTSNGQYSWIGENLYKGKCDIDYAYTLWQQSPSHLAVLQHAYDEEALLQGSYGEDKCYYVLIRGILK